MRSIIVISFLLFSVSVHAQKPIDILQLKTAHGHPMQYFVSLPVKKFLISGFEAGAHTVWQFVFQHPEKLKTAAPVAGNFNRNNCMTAEFFSKDATGINLPIKGFSGKLDTLYGPASLAYGHWESAVQMASTHGYKNISETISPGKGYVPLPCRKKY